MLPYFKQWQIAPFNPETWQREPYRTDHPVNQVIQNWFEDCSSVLDVGCGSCPDVTLFQTDYYGVDVTPKFVQTAYNHHKVSDLFIGSVLNLPFHMNSFEGVYCKDLLEHLPPDTWRQAVSEMIRVANRKVLFVFFKTFGEECYVQEEKIGFYHRPTDRLYDFGFWCNRYNYDEFMDYLKTFNVKKIHSRFGVRDDTNIKSKSKDIIRVLLKVK